MYQKSEKNGTESDTLSSASRSLGILIKERGNSLGHRRHSYLLMSDGATTHRYNHYHRLLLISIVVGVAFPGEITLCAVAEYNFSGY